MGNYAGAILADLLQKKPASTPIPPDWKRFPIAFQQCLFNTICCVQPRQDWH